jgi:FtsP/CotA-like multicopper oxidase with cupredoxin domain
MSGNRRTFFRDAAAFGAGIFGWSTQLNAQASAPATAHAGHVPENHAQHHPRDEARPGPAVVTPDVPDLPCEMDGGVKVFKLTSELVRRKIAPFKTIDAWGYNGSCPGPTIQIQQGDRVRVIFENRLPESTTVHWHGLEIPIEQDGVPWISQKPVPPGEKYTYEFTVHQEGTFFYHAHSAMQEMMGQIGLFIAHPEKPYKPLVDHDFAMVLQEWAVLPSNTVPNSAGMEFNWLTFNGVSAPAITPMIARLGSRVRLRIVNLGMDHHPIHLHGNQFVQTGTEGGRAPESSWYPMNTVLVGVAQARVIEFDARFPGSWMVHCHLPHHMMNQMSSMVGPMSRRRDGIPAGLDMERGMGMLQQGSATSEENGPSLGRGLGVGSTAEQTVSNSPLKAWNAVQHEDMPDVQPQGMQMSKPEVSKDANSVPGFPQDAFMEGPTMAMDQMVDKPENFGLRPGWSGFMAGMMTFVRVLPPDKYDHIMELRKKQEGNQPMKLDMPGMEHKHE